MSEHGRSLRIGLDFDGVLSNCAQLKHDAAMELYGVDIDARYFKRELVVGSGILTAEQYNHLQRIICTDPAWGLRMMAIPEAIAHAQQLAADGHDLQIISSRGPAGVRVAKAWLERAGLQIEMTGTSNTSKRTAATGLDIYVDDDLDKLVDIDVVPERYLMSQPYNEHEVLPDGIERVTNWSDFYRRIGQTALAGN